MNITPDYIGKTVDLIVKREGIMYILPACTIVTVDEEWISYLVPDKTRALLKQEDVIRIKTRS